MKFPQLFLIFAVAINWASSEYNALIIKKQLTALKNSLDTEAQACGDFYQFACGHWLEHQSKPKLPTFVKMVYETNNELISLMETMSMNGKPSFVKKAFDLFTSCSLMVSKLHEAPYIDWMIEHENVTWSLLSDTDDFTFDHWVHLLGVTIKYDMNDVFINVKIQDEQNGAPTKIIFGINKFVSGASILDEEFLTTIKKRLPVATKDFDELWSIIENFQLRLITLRLDVVEKAERKLVTLKDLPTPWLQQVVSTILPSSDDNTEIYIENEAYFLKLDEILQQYDDSFLSTYLELQFLKKFYSVIQKTNPNTCMLATRNVMPLAMNWIYEKQHPELQDQIPQVNQMFSSVLSSLNDSLSIDQSGLIPEEYLNKLSNVQLKVGILPRVDTDQILEKFYEKLEISDSDFHENIIKTFSFSFNAKRYYNVKELAANVDTFFDIYLPTEYLNYWAKDTDIFIISTMMLRQPLHHWGYEEAMVYGGLGTFIAKTLFADMLHFNAGFTRMLPEQKQKVFLAAAINAAYNAYIKLYPDALNLSSPRRLFFLSAAQFQCTKDDDTSEIFNSALSFVPGFSKAFECNTYEYLELFNRA